MSLESGGYRGYCTHNYFGSFRMPVPAQNIIYLDYVKKNNLKLKLSVNEFDIKGCFLNFKILLTELDSLDGILFCSAYMLPDHLGLRSRLYEIAGKNNVSVHFIFENIVCRSEKDFLDIERVILCRKELKKTEGLEEKIKKMGSEKC